jgi:hypothetical protein
MTPGVPLDRVSLVGLLKVQDIGRLDVAGQQMMGMSRVMGTNRASSSAGDASGHIEGDGWITPVVNPPDLPVQGSHGPEGQAFVVSTIAGYKAWDGMGQPGANAAGNSMDVGDMLTVVPRGVVSSLFAVY